MMVMMVAAFSAPAKVQLHRPMTRGLIALVSPNFSGSSLSLASSQVFGQRATFGVTYGLALVFGFARDRPLDVIKLADPIERLLGNRRVGGFLEVEEFSPPVGPASRLFDLNLLGQEIRLVHGVEASDAIGLQHAIEALQEGPWMIALTIPIVEVGHSRRIGSLIGTPVPDHDPDVAIPGLPGLGCKHRYLGVVAMQMGRCQRRAMDQFSNEAQLAAAIRAGVAGIENTALTRQMSRQLLAAAFFLVFLVPIFRLVISVAVRFGLLGGAIGLKILECQFQLIDLMLQLLR